VPAISTNDLKNGITLNLDGTLYTVVEFQHVKPGKGGAFVRSKLRNLRSNNMLEKTFNAGVKVEQAILEKKRHAVLVQGWRRVCVHGSVVIRSGEHQALCAW